MATKSGEWSFERELENAKRRAEQAEARLREVEQKLEGVREWAGDRALPSNSEFIQGVRAAQDRAAALISDTPSEYVPEDADNG